MGRGQGAHRPHRSAPPRCGRERSRGSPVLLPWDRPSTTCTSERHCGAGASSTGKARKTPQRRKGAPRVPKDQAPGTHRGDKTAAFPRTLDPPGKRRLGRFPQFRGTDPRPRRRVLFHSSLPRTPGFSPQGGAGGLRPAPPPRPGPAPPPWVGWGCAKAGAPNQGAEPRLSPPAPLKTWVN